MERKKLSEKKPKRKKLQKQVTIEDMSMDLKGTMMLSATPKLYTIQQDMEHPKVMKRKNSLAYGRKIGKKVMKMVLVQDIVTKT